MSITTTRFCMGFVIDVARLMWLEQQRHFLPPHVTPK